MEQRGRDVGQVGGARRHGKMKPWRLCGRGVGRGGGAESARGHAGGAEQESPIQWRCLGGEPLLRSKMEGSWHRLWYPVATERSAAPYSCCPV